LSNIQACGHGLSMPEWSGTSVLCRSQRPSVQPETSAFCRPKSPAHTTSPTQQVWPPSLCHAGPSTRNSLPDHVCNPLRLRNDLYCVGWGIKLYSLTLQSKLHQSCLNASA